MKIFYTVCLVFNIVDNNHTSNVMFQGFNTAYHWRAYDDMDSQHVALPV